GYGRAEALLERKWPEKYNPAGHLTWTGRLYGRGLTEALTWRRGRIYHGTWGRAPFQSLYQPAVGLLGGLSLMPEWYLLIVARGPCSARTVRLSFGEATSTAGTSRCGAVCSGQAGCAWSLRSTAPADNSCGSVRCHGAPPGGWLLPSYLLPFPPGQHLTGPGLPRWK